MQWREEGIVLSARKHGESSIIAEVLTRAHGRHAGVVRGGASRKMAAMLQPGSQLDLTWRARLEEHLGSFRVEPIRLRAGALLNDPLALAGMSAVCALLGYALPEREAHARLYDRTVALLDLIGINPAWPVAYLKWELALLEELGFGLDLGSCAVTGSTRDLVHVSPRSGRAVSAAGAGAWADRLLPLVPEMLGAGSGAPENLRAGLSTTGHFLETRLAEAIGRPLPQARARLLDRLARL